jgi:hypothetical protein
MFSSSRNRLRASELQRLLSEQRRLNPGFKNESAPLAESIEDSFNSVAELYLSEEEKRRKRRELEGGE